MINNIQSGAQSMTQRTSNFVTVYELSESLLLVKHIYLWSLGGVSVYLTYIKWQSKIITFYNFKSGYIVLNQNKFHMYLANATKRHYNILIHKVLADKQINHHHHILGLYVLDEKDLTAEYSVQQYFSFKQKDMGISLVSIYELCFDIQSGIIDNCLGYIQFYLDNQKYVY